MSLRLHIHLFVFLLFLSSPAIALEIWVDHENGSDQADGSEATPVKNVAAGLEKLQPGDTLHLVPGDSPLPGGIRITVNGTQEKPIVVDGHGSVVSGKSIVPLTEWKDAGDGIYSRPLPNNAWGMESHWEGGFSLVWFNSADGVNVSSRDELKPGSYFLYKNRKNAKADPLHNTLFIKPASEKSTIETITGEGGIYVGGNYIIVRNFVCEYGGRDGFATHANKGVEFENIEARYFMDQGMSHHGAEVVVRNAHFHHNAGGGIVDVYPEARVRYEDCLIENDTWRGGVEFHKGKFEMLNCTIRSNGPVELTVTKGAAATLTNCVISGSGKGIVVGSDSHLSLKQCRLDESELTREIAGPDFIVFSTTPPAIENEDVLAAHKAELDAARERKKHVDAVIAALDASPGKYQKINTTPEALKAAIGKDLPVFDSLLSVDLSQTGMSVKKKRESDPFDAAFFEHLGQIPQLEAIRVLHTKPNDDWVAPLGQLTNLKRLEFINTGMTDAGLAHLSKLKNLERFAYIGTQMTGEPFANFDGFTKLTSSSFRGSRINDEGLRHLCEKFPNYETLSLAHAKFTDAGAVHLTKLKKLKGLEIGSRNASPACLKSITSLPLEYLQLGDGLGAPEGIDIIQGIPTLRRLTLTNCSLLSTADLEKVAEMKQLTKLELGKLKPTGEVADVLTKMSHLEALRLANYGPPFPETFTKAVSEALPNVQLTTR